MYILLPPSEGKSPVPGKRSFRALCPDLAPDVQRVIDMLAGLSVTEQRALYGLKSEDKAAEAHAQNLGALDAPCIPAIARYTGVVYHHLDFDTLSHKANARKRILIVSALFGLIDGGTPIPPYKLSMTPWLTKYWRSRNSHRLGAIAGGKP
ncbi:MAG: peroxide stress protein YaaA, partial [Verrucomicrobiales bacterium]